MQYDEFIDRVQRRAGLDQRDPAWDLTCRTLETLGECLDPNRASDLASQLPEALQGCLDGVAGAQDKELSPEEFVRTVGERVGYDAPEDQLRTHVGATLATLRDATTPTDWTELLGQLPSGYGELM